MSIGRGDEARCHVVAEQRYGGGVSAVAHCQRAAGAAAVLRIAERRAGTEADAR